MFVPNFMKETQRLTQDPVIKQMAQALPRGTDLFTFESMEALYREFVARGGRSAFVTGPARALRLLTGSALPSRELCP